jgi:hypothetical protein
MARGDEPKRRWVISGDALAEDYSPEDLMVVDYLNEKWAQGSEDERLPAPEDAVCSRELR